MIIVKKYFSKRSENFKGYNVGDKASFTKEEEEYLVKKGFADFVEKKTKPEKKEIKKPRVSKVEK